MSWICFLGDASVRGIRIFLFILGTDTHKRVWDPWKYEYEYGGNKRFPLIDRFHEWQVGKVSWKKVNDSDSGPCRAYGLYPWFKPLCHLSATPAT